MGTALDKLRQSMAVSAEEYSNEEQVSGLFLSTRGGILKYGEETLPGNEMIVVVLDAIHENTYYPDRFDADNILPPKCFAFGRKEKDMEPYETVLFEDEEGFDDSYFEAQHDLCADCPKAEFGSADTGRGKACSNRRRLAVIPAGQIVEEGTGRNKELVMEVFDKPDHYRDADMAFLKVPVTSVKNWSKYVHQLSKERGRPPYGVLTRIYLEPDPKTSFKVAFEFIEDIEDEDVLEIVLGRHAMAKEDIIQPYEEPSQEELERPATKSKSRLDGVKERKR